MTRPFEARFVSASLALALALCVSGEAQAHLVSTRFGELYSGIVHPLTTLVHLVPWLGLGLLGGLQPAPVARWSSVVLPLAAGVGSWVGCALPGLSQVEYFTGASFVVFGALAALAVPLGARSLGGLSALVGLTHGYANGNAQLEGGERLLYVAGVCIAAYALVTLVTAGAHLLRERTRWGRIALRAGGSWIVAIGLIFGAFTFWGAAGS